MNETVWPTMAELKAICPMIERAWGISCPAHGVMIIGINADAFIEGIEYHWQHQPVQFFPVEGDTVPVVDWDDFEPVAIQ